MSLRWFNTPGKGCGRLVFDLTHICRNVWRKFGLQLWDDNTAEDPRLHHRRCYEAAPRGEGVWMRSVTSSSSHTSVIVCVSLVVSVPASHRWGRGFEPARVRKFFTVTGRLLPCLGTTVGNDVCEGWRHSPVFLGYPLTLGHRVRQLGVWKLCWRQLLHCKQIHVKDGLTAGRPRMRGAITHTSPHVLVVATEAHWWLDDRGWIGIPVCNSTVPEYYTIFNY